MDEQENNKQLEESKSCVETVHEDIGVYDNDGIERTLKPQERIVSNSEVFAGIENEVITVVTQDNNEEIYIYERSENNGVHSESISEFIQVCDSNNAFEEINDSQNDDVINVDVLEGEDKENYKKDNVESKNENLENINNGEEIVVEETEKVNENENICNISNEKSSENANQLKNFKNVILEDWEVEVPHIVENHEPENFGDTIVIEELQSAQILETSEVATFNNVGSNTIAEIKPLSECENITSNASKEKNSLLLNQNNPSAAQGGEILKVVPEKKIDSLKLSNSIVTKEDIVEILDKSVEQVVKPITGKDLFFSIELTKKLNQKLSLNKSLNKSSETVEKKNISNESESCNNSSVANDHQKIVAILEADEIKDWKSVPNKSNLKLIENENDMEISKAVKSMEQGDPKLKLPIKNSKRTSMKKFKTMDKELERTIALQQLRKEFPSTRKRSKTTKKVNRIPFLASTVLEKALTSPEVSTALKPGPPKRRPCYLPENVSYSKSSGKVSDQKALGDKMEILEEKNTNIKSQSDELNVKETDSSEKSKLKSNKQNVDLDIYNTSNSSIPNTVVRTYTVKRKSTDAENDIRSTLEAVTKALNETKEEVNEFKPKKQKTAIKKVNTTKSKVLVKKKTKVKSNNNIDSKKRISELERLLGDEGAIRMLYDTQHKDNSTSTPKKSKIKTNTGLKKDLMLKTKLVKNAVLRLSGVGSEGISLRGKRRLIKSEPETSVRDSEPLFSSTPNVVLYKPKKKQRAEASRILYRHSSSESFDSSEGYRRTSFDADGFNTPFKEALNAKNNEAEVPGVKSMESEKSTLKPLKSIISMRKRIKRLGNLKDAKDLKVIKAKDKAEKSDSDHSVACGSKLNLSNVPLRKSSRPRMVSKKYSIWSSTSMDSLSAESLGFKKVKKASTDIAKKLNCKELVILQYEHLVQIVLNPVSTMLKNSLNLEVLQELIQVFSFLSEEGSCKVVLLTSTGGSFCQGVDLSQIISVKDSERRNIVSQLLKTLREFVTCLADFIKPVIVGVHAGAVGLGVTLLPYCDLVICSDKASFYTPYVKLGQAPEGAPTHTFPRISRHLVSELLFTNHKMTATDALKHGLVSQVIAEERFEEELMLISRNLAAQPSRGMQSIKFLQRSSQQDEIQETLRLEGEMLEEHWNNNECRNNMIKFLNSGELQLKYLDNT